MWVPGKSDLVDESKIFELHGGALELADGVSQSLDTLPLMTNAVSGVILGMESTLQLGELSFTARDATLAVTGPEVVNGRRTGLRIGTSATLIESVLDTCQA